MMRQVKHNNVLKLFELYEGENYIYCLSEFLGGGQLFNYIKKFTFLSEDECLKFIKQLLEVKKFKFRLWHIWLQNILYTEISNQKI